MQVKAPFLLSASGADWKAWVISDKESNEQIWDRLRTLDLTGRNWIWLKGGAIWPIHALLPPLTPMQDPGLPPTCLGSRCPVCLWVRTDSRMRCLCTLFQRCPRCGLPEGNPAEDLADLRRSHFRPSPLFLGMRHRCVLWGRVKILSIQSHNRPDLRR